MDVQLLSKERGTTDSKSEELIWGQELRPYSDGAGTLVEHLLWLNSKLSEGQVLPLDQQSGRTLWSPLPPCVGKDEVFAVAVYFSFQEPEALDACCEKLRDATMAVGADMWQRRPDDLVDGARDYAMLLLFDPSSPLVGPMQADEVVLAVRHYLGYCAARAPFEMKRHRRVKSQPYWDGAHSAVIELVLMEKKEAWLASRQFLLSFCNRLGRLRGWGFCCETPCREESDDM